MNGDNERPTKRPKRTYRACYPCRSRKLKCSFGDPNLPWDGPCERCLREQRECIRAKATFVRDPVPRKSDLVEERQVMPGPPRAAPQGHYLSRTQEAARHGSTSPTTRRSPSSSLAQRRASNGPHSASPAEYAQHRSDDMHDKTGSDDDDDELEEGTDTLVSSNLQNPSDALKLLASASSLQYRGLGQPAPQPRPKDKPVWPGNNASMWCQWGPIAQGCLTVQDARALFSFFELEMAPLYPLLHPSVFEPHYLETLIKGESLLLASIIVIAARYSKILADNRGDAVHRKLSQWVRQRILAIVDGEPSLRTISSVEALLLLSEWPMLPMSRAGADSSCDPMSEEALLLKPSLRYDAYSWAYIGMAVRLAQELGLHDMVNLAITKTNVNSWKQNRMLKTWVYAYNADRHIAIRLGRNAVLQVAMSSRWWESFSAVVCNDDRATSNDVWTSDTFMLGSVAQLLGAIQDHLYPNKEVTRSLLNTGTWEGFLRSVRLEIRYSKHACRAKLEDGSVDSALLRIELDYVVLYAYSLALRALQGKLRRRRQVGDRHYHSPSLLNMVEGPWIMESLSAARSIIEITLTVLEERKMLRYCPSRIFQYILFATTFLYKALAAGMVEYGQQNMSGMLDRVVDALGSAAIDNEHFLHGFAVLLKRLGKHWRTSNASTSPSVLNRPGPERPENAGESGDGAPPMPSFPGSSTPTVPNRDSGDDLALSDLQSFQFDLPGVNPDDHTSAREHTASAPFLSASQPPTGPSGLTHEEFTWSFDPTFQMPAADHEQDMLFQSIWDNTQDDTSVSTSNLYATLLGDTLSFPEGFEV